MPGVIGADLADILAVCRPRLAPRREREVAHRADLARRASNAPKPTIGVYQDYRELLARTDIDAVRSASPITSTPRSRSRALRAGKDVYLQKPFTMTHAEGSSFATPSRRTGRILQVGSQQRSWGPNEQFRKAVELVRSGRVGNLRRVEIGLPIDPTAPDSPEQPVPANLNYDMWLGPTPEAYYTEQRVHSQRTLANGEPDIQSRPGWLRNETLLARHDHRVGRAPLRHGALGHGHGAHRPVTHRRARRVPDEQDLERARQVPCRAHVSRQRQDDGVGRAAERHQVHRRRRLDLRLARLVADGERSVGSSDVAQVARRERPAAARSDGAEGRASAQHVAPQELARVRPVAEAAARARAGRACQQQRVHPQLDRDEAEPSRSPGTRRPSVS